MQMVCAQNRQKRYGNDKVVSYKIIRLMDCKAFHVLSMKHNIDFPKYSDHLKIVPLDDVQEATAKYFSLVISP